MAIPAAVGQIYAVNFELVMFGQRLLNTFKYRLDTLPVAASTKQVCDAANTALQTINNLKDKYLNAVPTQVLLNNIVIQTIYPTRARREVYALSQSGLWLGAAIVANTAISIERFGETATRHSIGRVQLPASNQSVDVNNGVLQAAGYITALNNFKTQMLAQLMLAAPVGTLTPVLVRSPVDGNYEYLNGTTLQLTSRVMRRRTVGVGK